MREKALGLDVGNGVMSSSHDLRALGLTLPIAKIASALGDYPTVHRNGHFDFRSVIVSLGHESIRGVLSDKKYDDIGTLIVVRSLPYPSSAQIGFLLAEAANIRPGRIIEMGGNCSSVVDALLLAATLQKSDPAKPVIVTVADAFSSLLDEASLREKPGAASWRSGATSVLLFSDPAMNIDEFQISAMSTSTASEFYKLAEIIAVGNYHRLRFSTDIRQQFNSIDVGAELETIERALNCSDAQLREDAVLISINRDPARSDGIQRALKLSKENIFASRGPVGHTGGGDLLINLERAVRNSAQKLKQIIISANGLGYCWSVMIVEKQ